jgi:uracil-DNA glycosylase
MSADLSISAIAAEVRSCTACPLHMGRTNAVPGEGPPNAELLLIGEGPGFHEDQQGRPFVGPAGQFLEELLALAGYRRDQVFITNVVKCRPPGNRDPQENEIAACTQHHLARQIEVINPRVIVTLGRVSMAYFISDARISAIHGKPRSIAGRLMIPMYHPAAALHQPSLRSVVEEDFRRLPELIARQPAPDDNAPDSGRHDAQQLSLF